MSRRLRIAALLGLGGLVVFPACNVFLSLDQCSSEADCPQGYSCDREARFCIAGEARDSSTGDVSVGDDASSDAAVGDALAEADAPPPCDVAGAFGGASLVKGLEDRSISSGRLTADETTLVFSAATGCADESCIDLYVAKRGNLDASFAVTGLFPGVNVAAASEYWPTFTSDNLLMFFESSRSAIPLPDGGFTNERARIWTTQRSNTTAQFSPPYIQEIFNVSDAIEGAPYLHPKGASLYFMSSGRSGKGGFDLFVATLGGDFGAALSVENISGANTAAPETAPVVSDDNLALYFARESPVHDIMVSKRASPGESFGLATPLSELNTPHHEWPLWLSIDQCRLYFASDRPTGPDDAGVGTVRLWMAQRSK
jgi:hypothetical protein